MSEWEGLRKRSSVEENGRERTRMFKGNSCQSLTEKSLNVFPLPLDHFAEPSAMHDCSAQDPSGVSADLEIEE